MGAILSAAALLAAAPAVAQRTLTIAAQTPPSALDHDGADPRL